MNIGIEIAAGTRIEFELSPTADDLWRLGKVVSNDSGLLTWFTLKRHQASRTPEEAHKEKHRCVLGAPWQCPFEHFICTQPRKNRTKLAQVGYTDYVDHLQPILQLSLFEPDKKTKRVWKHVRTGAIADLAERPVEHVLYSCKQFAVAHTKYMESKLGWNPVRWRIRPLDRNQKAGQQWAEQQAERHQNHLPACTFFDL